MVVVGISTYTSQVVRMVKKPHATAVDVTDWVQSLGQENLREKGMATHSSIRTWEIPWQAIVHGVVKELDTT